MIKKRNLSVHSDLKTGFFSKFLIILGFVFLAFFIIEKLFLFIILDENILGTILAFAILFLGAGFIIYFFYCQLAKLSKIADEIENENTELRN